jgi:hypothetical protein
MSASRDLAIAAAVALLAIGTLEVGLRVAGAKFEPSLYEPHPKLYFVPRPGAEGWTVKEGENYVRINGLGMHDRERTVEAPAGTVRLAFLGDSMIAAQQIPLERSTAQLVEHGLSRALATSGHRVEVLNFSVGGYVPSQMYLALDERVWKFHPDVVVVFVSVLTVPNSYRKTTSSDDVPLLTLEGGQLIADPGNRPPSGTSERSRYWHRILGDLHNEFRIFQLARTAQQAKWSEALSWRRPAAPTADAVAAPEPAEMMRVWQYRPPWNPDLEKAWDIAEAILTSMIEDAHRHGAEFWLIRIGSEIEEHPSAEERERFLVANGLSGFGYASGRYAALAARHGANYLDLASGMRQRSIDGGRPLRGFFNTEPYTGHWNEAGHAAAAEIIEGELLAKSGVIALAKADRPRR